MKKWPNFFIIGVPRAGTSALYAYLKKIPGIYMSPVKEPNYFSINFDSFKSYKRRYVSTKKYQSLFKNVKDEKIVG